MRPLTRNEKRLILALVIVLFLWGAFRFVITPQKEKLIDLETSKIEYENLIMQNNNILKREGKIKEEWEVLNKQREEIFSNYFPVLDQAQIIYLLNDILEDERVNINELSFSRPVLENIDEMEVSRMDLLIPFNGSYAGVIDIVKAIEKSPRKIIVDGIGMDRIDSNNISGNMNLKIYSLEEIAETNSNIIHIDTPENNLDTPFKAYDDFEDSANLKYEENNDESLYASLDEEDTKEGKILYDFENGKYEFIPSSPMVKGNAIPSTISKSGKFSLRLEYDILALEDENRAYIDLSSNNIILKVSPESIGFWAYSYGYSPGTLGMRLKGQAGEEIDIEIAQGITWTGWSYLEVDIPSDLKMYPLIIDKLFYEIPFNREDFGIILIDKLEVYYSNNEDSAIKEEVNEFYIVKPGDTVTEISRKVYGTTAYKNEIMKLNDISPGEILRVGKILVLKRH